MIGGGEDFSWVKESNRNGAHACTPFVTINGVGLYVTRLRSVSGEFCWGDPKWSYSYTFTRNGKEYSNRCYLTHEAAVLAGIDRILDVT